MSTRTDTAAQAAIGAAARDLHLPTVRDEATRLAEIAVRERQSHLGFWPKYSPPKSMTAMTGAGPGASPKPSSPA